MDTGCYVNGEWVATDATFEVTDPATGEIVGAAPDAGPELATSAIDGLQISFSGGNIASATMRMYGLFW